MRRTVVFLAIPMLFAMGAGCKKPESACMKKCKRLLACFEETRGKVSDDKAALSHCERVCQGKGAKADQKALAGFDPDECGAWMRQHTAVAERALKNKGGAEPGAAREATAGQAEHPFPKLLDEPPKDPKARAGHRSAVQDRVDRIVLTSATETVELRRVERGTAHGDTGRWDLVKPEKSAGDRFAVRNLLNRLERLHVAGRAEISSKEFEANHLTEKHGVRCQVFAGDEVLADMIVGKADRAGAKGRGAVATLIRKTGTDEVWRITGSLTYLFKRPVESWRDASVFQIKAEDLVSFTILLTGGKLVLKRDAEEKDPRKRLTNWVIAESEPKLETLDQNAITRLVSVLTHLRAPSFEKDATAETTGLDKPRATLVAQDKAGKTISLLIGNRDAQRRAAFAKIQGEDRVFLVRHPLDELPDEPITAYRDKTLVQAELNQVVGLVVEKEGTSVEFAKEGTVWKAVKPADLKVNISRLISTVRLLEGRFSAHELSKETSAAVTGLDKPEGRILVKVQAAPDKPVTAVEIVVGKAGPRGDYFVQVKGRPEVFLIRRWVLTRVWQSATEWTGAGPAAGPGTGPGAGPASGRGGPPLPGRLRPPVHGAARTPGLGQGQGPGQGKSPPMAPFRAP